MNNSKVDVNYAEANEGFTALHWAVEEDETKVIEVLLSHPEIEVSLLSFSMVHTVCNDLLVSQSIIMTRTVQK